MYPDLQQLIERIFGIEAPQFLAVIKTFGLFVAISFLAGAWLLNKELQRKEKSGHLQPHMMPRSRAKNYLGKQQPGGSIENVPVYFVLRSQDYVSVFLVIQ
jgi:hypothetical protein